MKLKIKNPSVRVDYANVVLIQEHKINQNIILLTNL